MIEITIDGLNARQQILADMIWACESKADINRLIKSLPTQEMKDEASSIVDLMLMATIEQCYDGLGSMDEAQALISKARKG
jgi:hypothetical protein